MLSQLLADAQALAAALPTLQAAASAVSADLSAAPPVTLAQLQTDATALTAALSPVINDIAALQADLSALPQGIHHPQLAAALESAMPMAIGAPNWTAILAKVKQLLAEGVNNWPAIEAALLAMGVPASYLAIIQFIVTALGGLNIAPTA